MNLFSSLLATIGVALLAFADSLGLGELFKTNNEVSDPTPTEGTNHVPA